VLAKLIFYSLLTQFKLHLQDKGLRTLVLCNHIENLIP
jgi:hypothetical protein